MAFCLFICHAAGFFLGRRDPAMSVMLYRSTFSECLLKLLGRAIPKEQKEKFRVMNHIHDTQTGQIGTKREKNERQTFEEATN